MIHCSYLYPCSMIQPLSRWKWQSWGSMRYVHNLFHLHCFLLAFLPYFTSFLFLHVKLSFIMVLECFSIYLMPVSEVGIHITIQDSSPWKCSKGRKENKEKWGKNHVIRTPEIWFQQCSPFLIDCCWLCSFWMPRNDFLNVYGWRGVWFLIPFFHPAKRWKLA